MDLTARTARSLRRLDVVGLVFTDLVREFGPNLDDDVVAALTAADEELRHDRSQRNRDYQEQRVLDDNLPRLALTSLSLKARLAPK